MKTFLALAMLFCASSLASAQEGLMERVARIEANNAAITSMLTRQKADIDNLQLSVDRLTAKVDALVKSQGASFTSSTDWAGDQQFTAAWSNKASYSAGQPTRAGLFRRGGFFRSRLLGGCAGGG